MMTQDVRDLIAEAREAMTERDDTGWFWVGRLADALEAATEELEAKLENARAAAKLSHGFLEIEKEEHAETGAERDAAVAAIERVRELHQPMWYDGEQVCDFCYGEGYEEYRSWPCDTRRALDGAPEPEEKP